MGRPTPAMVPLHVAREPLDLDHRLDTAVKDEPTWPISLGALLLQQTTVTPTAVFFSLFTLATYRNPPYRFPGWYS